MKKFMFIIMLLTSFSALSFGQPTDCEVIQGGYVSNSDCYTCRLVRVENNVWDYGDPVIHTLPDQPMNGPGSVIYNCTEGTTASSLTAQSTVSVSESLTFSEGGFGNARVGLSALVVAQGTFGLSASSGGNSSVTGSSTVKVTRNNVSDCDGVGIETEYTRFQRTGYIREFARVSHYICDCITPDGILFEGVSVTYKCQPRLVHANSDLIRSTANVWVRSASFFPPRAPSASSPSRCNSYCNPNDDDGSCDCSDDLDPEGDEDGDGIRNADDDRPYGYDGDDPNGDDDGDGTSNADDATPYGYDGDDPNGDDDGDGVKNSQDKYPNCPDDPEADNDDDGIPNCEDDTPNGEDRVFTAPGVSFRIRLN